MRTIARIVATVVVLTVAVGAQQKPKTSPTPTPSPKSRPNFSGRWEAVSPKENAGVVNNVTQDEKTLVAEEVTAKGSRKMTYQLDGVERRIALPGRGADINMMATASWDGDHIVITTKASYPNGMKTQSKETWSIDPQGRLVIEYAESGPPGPAPVEKVIYVKK